MKIHVLSDLHCEFARFDPPQTDADVVVLAGDIHVGNKAIGAIAEMFPDRNARQTSPFRGRKDSADAVGIV